MKFQDWYNDRFESVDESEVTFTKRELKEAFKAGRKAEREERKIANFIKRTGESR